MNDLVSNPMMQGAKVAAAPSQSNAVAKVEEQRAIAEVQAALLIARSNPRDPVAAMDRILNACARPSLADAAVYTYGRGGSDVSGPSIRLAEAMAQSWGNMQFGIRELDQRNGESTVQAFAWDVETNTRREVTFQVPHLRYTKNGSKRLEDPRDIYEMVANQGARRLRACILAVIPGDVTEAAVSQCEVTMKAKADTSPEGLKKLEDAFATYGVTKTQIEKRIQRRLDAIQPAQVVALKKIYASLRDGMSSVGEWFEPDEEQANAQATPASKTESVKEKLKQNANRAQAQPEPEKPQQTETSAPQSTGDIQSLTFAQVAEKLNKASDVDLLDIAADMINMVADASQRDELKHMYESKRAGFINQ